MLPPLPIGMALLGVTRRGGVARQDEDTSVGRRRVLDAPGGTAAATGDGAARLLNVAKELRARAAAPGSLSRRWRDAVQTNMAFKQQQYTRQRDAIQAELDDQQGVVASFVRAARRGGDNALADEQTSNWEVAEKVSARWQRLVLESASLERLVRSAQQRSDAMTNQTDFAMARAELALALDKLASDFRSQHVLLEAVADTIDAFVNHPLVSTNAFLNFVLMGQPGVGKTRLASSLASVVGKLGLVIFDDAVVCGRSDFVAEFEGQTATKARTFLTSQLERCVFLDEAYSLTTWEASRMGDDGARTLSAYSAEAVAELVAFLSQRVGATVFIAAGYEHEMLTDFLPSNEGLQRRFPYKLWMTDYSADELVDIYLDNLATALSGPPPAPPLTHNTVRVYFTSTALTFLSDLFTGARETAATGARHPLLHQLVSAQAGFAVALASTTALLVSSSNRTGTIGVDGGGSDTWAIGYLDMRSIWETLLAQQYGPHASDALRELNTVAMEAGWRTAAGTWQVPPSAVARLRARQ
jgi:hypothetical protein